MAFRSDGQGGGTLRLNVSSDALIGCSGGKLKRGQRAGATTAASAPRSRVWAPEAPAPADSVPPSPGSPGVQGCQEQWFREGRLRAAGARGLLQAHVRVALRPHPRRTFLAAGVSPGLCRLSRVHCRHAAVPRGPPTPGARSPVVAPLPSAGSLREAAAAALRWPRRKRPTRRSVPWKAALSAAFPASGRGPRSQHHRELGARLVHLRPDSETPGDPALRGRVPPPHQGREE
ncbi:uncharacterized protein RBU33_000934 isoform 1-T1 [Hipposideros larvatus]